MSDRKAADVKLLLLQPAAAAYSEDIADLILTLYTRPATGQEMRVYIVGCLVLTLTASVLPQYTLLADRLSTLPSSTSPSTSPSSLSLAKAGFVHLGPGDGSLVCFHCCVRVSPTASTTEELPPPSSSSSRDTFVDRFDDIELTDRCGLGAAGSDHDDEPLRRHRRASPNCYYARLCALARAVSRSGAGAGGLGIRRLAERLDAIGDAKRYARALRKLRGCLLGGCGLSLAASFGYSPPHLAAWLTRYFMRNNGACPTRAGDIIALAHESEAQSLLAPGLLDILDIVGLLQLPELL
ncbi:hypothetical protein BOX15_Mlig010893g1 [Macrostomum lignano]|uniref:Uncharacterized protein n=1 Tax=Macrostomum lignano TaxID=282301 RepID=A0A267FEJ9_9PLAT|nr:hypothetical protein BOX15_Mlig010893g2 [Macrostomum lignano]PAA72205.1 hypothetical protein BOX15_Mlig010893g1 [Macrostomum lignano]